jgi:virginiamycin B lyase
LRARRKRLFANVLRHAALGALLFGLNPASVLSIEIMIYSAPAARAEDQILRGSDGNIFFTQGPNKISRITPSGGINGKRLGTPEDVAITGIATGANGDLWITDSIAASIGMLKPDALAPRNNATLYEHRLQGNRRPQHIALGVDKNFWVADSTRDRLMWVKGTFFEEYRIPSINAGIAGIAVSADGTLWFSERNVAKIGRAIPGGIVSELSLPTEFSQPKAIVVGPDGNVWYTDPGANVIGRIDSESLAITEYPIPSAPGGLPNYISSGSDGNLWYTATRANKVSRVTMAGVITEFDLPGVDGPGALTQGHDGNLWVMAKDQVAVLKDPAFKLPAPLPTVFSFDAAFHAGYEKDRAVTVSIRRTGNTTNTATVRYGASDITGISGTHYLSISGALTFGPDEISKVLSIPLLDDEINDTDKAFNLRLSHPSDNAILGPTYETVITITDIHAPVDEALPANAANTLS